MAFLPLLLSLAGGGLAWLPGFWAVGAAVTLAGLGWEFQVQGLPDHAAMALAAALALLLGHGAGRLLVRLSHGRARPFGLGHAMATGLPPLGAFPGLWLGLQAVLAALLLLPAWPALAFALAGLLALGGGARAWGGERAAESLQRTAQDDADKPGWKRLGGRLLRAALMALGLAAAFLPWLWVLPAQLVAERLTHELPMLLMAFGMLLTPIIPGQGSVLPFGLMAIAMAFASVLLLVLRLTRRRA